MKPVIAMDIGGTNMRIALIDSNYHLLKVMRFPTIVGDKDMFMHQVAQSIHELDVKIRDVAAISIGVPGRVDSDGHITTLPNIKIQDIPLPTFLRRRFHVPVYIRNDAEMAALAEANLGAGKHFRRTFFITISTGVGGALVVNHELKYSSDEIGHTLFLYKNKYYEFEQIASGTGIINLCALNGLAVQASSLFFSLVGSGNPEALSVFEDWLSLMSAFINNIQTLFEPDIISITGGVMKSKDLFFDQLVHRVPSSKLVKAEFGDDAGLMGAASYAFHLPSVN
jgi:glucokinase